MTIALLALLAAGVLPYLCAGTAKFGGPGYDNARPRPSLASLSGWRQRADWAQRNHFEAFPLFAAATLAAELAHASQGRIDLLATLFVACRVVYTALYLGNLPTLRSVSWAAGFLCVLALFATAAGTTIGTPPP